MIVLLLWMWISSLTLLLGAEINKILTPAGSCGARRREKSVSVQRRCARGASEPAYYCSIAPLTRQNGSTARIEAHPASRECACGVSRRSDADRQLARDAAVDKPRTSRPKSRARGGEERSQRAGVARGAPVHVEHGVESAAARSVRPVPRSGWRHEVMWSI